MISYTDKQDIDHSAPTVVVGAGLAGSLMAIFLARRGHEVIILEQRSDPRKQSTTAGRSINLALSERGRCALRSLGLEKEIVAQGLPMYGRILHDATGERRRQPYGPSREHILSVSRKQLNEQLITVAEQEANVQFWFDHPVAELELETNTIRYLYPGTGRVRRLGASLIVGADGAFSAVREACRKTPRFDYAQSFLGHGYKELTIHPNEDGTHRMDADGLHIWPRHEHMLIALPNLDGSFTATLFLPWEGESSFDTLKTHDAVKRFLNREFPDAAKLMPDAAEEFLQNPAGTMVTIDSSPFHFGQGIVLIGDAAHAIVPFYGQGMNAAFEDCRILDELLAAGSTEEAIVEFTRRRVPQARAIRDLALANFHEMQSDVANGWFLAQKAVERRLEESFPERFHSLYSMVSFSNVPYAEAREIALRRRATIRDLAIGGAAAATLATLMAALKRG